MARTKNDGRGRLGGRAKGTPNKATKNIREWVAGVLDEGRDKFVEHLNGLDPQEYVRVFLRLLNYVAPKQAPVRPMDNEPDHLQEFMDRVNGYSNDD